MGVKLMSISNVQNIFHSPANRLAKHTFVILLLVLKLKALQSSKMLGTTHLYDTA